MLYDHKVKATGHRQTTSIPLAVVATSVVTADKTEACFIFTLFGTSVTHTLTTAWEVIEALLALVTLTTVHVSIARTFACLWVAHI